MSLLVRGFPSDENSSFLTGCAKAPEVIYNALFSDSSNASAESGVDLNQLHQFEFSTDFSLNKNLSFVNRISSIVDRILNENKKLISIGGDHAISFPIITATKNYYKQFSIVHFDAHPDLYENFDNNPNSHASPFARIKEQFPEIDLYQVGIRTINPHQLQQIDKYNVKVFDPDKFNQFCNLKIEGPIYISIDMDGFDPAFAPGVSHIEPGGLTSRQVINWIQTCSNQIIGADIVEYNPERDINQITAMLAAKLIKELAVKMI